MGSIFRKSALERLSSPEQLDKTIKITSPLSWLVILGVAVIISAFIFWSVSGNLPTTMTATGIVVNGYDTIPIHSMYAGKITESELVLDKKLVKGDVIGAIKNESGSESKIISTQTGTVTSVNFNVGDKINKYDLIARVTPDVESDDIVIAYLPIEDGKKIQVGMKAIVTPASFDAQNYGHMEAAVVSVDDYITTGSEAMRVIGSNESLLKYISTDDPMVTVALSMKTDESAVNGYSWSSERGKQLEISEGELMDIKIIASESAPITKLLPALEAEN